MDMFRLQSSTDSSSANMMDKAKRVWDMLDELASSDPTAYKNYITKTLNEGKEHMAPPTPYLAVQSVLRSNPKIKRLYLNVFTWPRLPPAEKTDQSIKIYPLTPTETTHNNVLCMIMNIAVHPNVTKDIPRSQLVQSTFDLLSSQYNLSLDYDQYVILDDKAIGDIEQIQQHFIKSITKKKNSDENVEELFDNDLSPSMIKQLSSMTVVDPSSSSHKQQQQKKNTKPAVLIEELWTIPTFTEAIANNNASLLVRVSLPECESVTDCDVTVLPEEDTIQVECSKLHMRLRLDMKERKKLNLTNGNSGFDVQHLTAKFVRKTQQLVLTIPIIPASITSEATN